jgi:hypothetical protein
VIPSSLRNSTETGREAGRQGGRRNNHRLAQVQTTPGINHGTRENRIKVKRITEDNVRKQSWEQKMKLLGELSVSAW